MASVIATQKDSSLSISRALEELEFKYTTPPDDIEPCIKFVSLLITVYIAEIGRN